MYHKKAITICTKITLCSPQIRSPTHTVSSMASAACSSSLISLSNPLSSHSRPSLTPSILNLRSSSSHFTSPSSLISLTPFHHIKPSFLASAPKCTINASSTAATNKKKVLIVNTNSGGHAVIGFYFAKDLLSSGHDVTVLTVGDESSDKMKKPPFTRFHELVTAGGTTVWGSPNDVRTAVGGHKFDVVLDNNGKDLDTVKPVADWAKSSGAEQFLYISSAGIYKPTDEVPHVEGDAVKAEASHVPVEKYISELSFSSCAIFRPQYMIGSGNNKDCEEWFFDRIVRDRAVPIPGSGMQLTNISHVRDLSSMLSEAVGNPAAAAGKIFNCVSDRAVTLDGFARLCAKAAGKEVKIVHYDPKAVGVEAKKAFPFRTMHFYAEPRAAKEILGWTSSTVLAVDLVERFEEYVEIGRDKKDMKFDTDDKILEAAKIVQVAV